MTTLLQHPCSFMTTIVYNLTIACSHHYWLFLFKGLWSVQSYSDQRRTVQMRDFPGRSAIGNTAELQDAWVILLLSETWRVWASQHLKSLGPFKMLPSSQIFLSMLSSRRIAWPVKERKTKIRMHSRVFQIVHLMDYKSLVNRCTDILWYDVCMQSPSSIDRVHKLTINFVT